VNNIPRKVLIPVGITLLIFLGLALANSNSQRGVGASQFLNVPPISAATTALSNQTVVPNESFQADPDPHVFQTIVSRPSKPAVGKTAITGTVDDVSIRNYIAANPIVGGVTAQNVQVVSIQYLSVQGLKTVLANGDPFWDGFPPDEPVAYVLLRGDFGVDIDPSVQDSRVTATYLTAYRVFSVRTGNELAGGAGPK
jgi:hypothetical protein